MREFCVNGKSYKAAPLDFNAVCELEDMGFSLVRLLKNPTSTIRVYFSLCAGISLSEAGNEIEKHIKENREMPKIAEVFIKEADESGFFQLVAEMAEKKKTESKAEE